MNTFPLLSQLLVSGLILGSVYALLAASFAIIYSTTRIFHLAHAVTYTTAAYAAVVSVRAFAVPLGVAIAIGLGIAVATGVVIELGAYRPMRRRSATVLTTFLVSLGLSVAGSSLIQIAFGPENHRLPGFPIQTIAIGAVTFTTLGVVSVVVAWLGVFGLLLFLKTTKYGGAIDAVRTNPELAIAVGIRVDQVFLLVFILGSGLIGVASLLFTMGAVAFPTMGITPVLIALIAAFFGGVGSTLGAALGGLAIGLVTALTGLWFSGDYAPVAVFGLLFLLLIVRPQGLLGQAPR